VALSEFIQQYRAHPGINAALTPDDVISGPIISYLKGKGIKAKAFPVTGQQATLPGLRNVLAGYQCGTAYEPEYLEAQGGGGGRALPAGQLEAARLAAEWPLQGPAVES
jgi:D-xylose transport system substrate-binding protein